MRGKRPFGATLALMAALVAFVAWFPGYRLDREVAAARREGLWTELGDLRAAIARRGPKGENAAPLVRQAIRLGESRGVERLVGIREWPHLSGNRTTAGEQARTRRFLLDNADLLERWREASRPSRLDFERRWEEGYAILMPEYEGLREGGRVLVLAAKHGLQPRDNLLAAARLSVLARQEPTMVAQIASVGMGRTVLDEANRRGMAREAEAALGPPIDVRWAYRYEFPAMLDAMRRVGTPGWERWSGAKPAPWWERLRHGGVFRTFAMWRVVHEVRAFWREMPTNGVDYARAIRAIDAHVPKIEDATDGLFGRAVTFHDVAAPVRALQNFAAERRRVPSLQ